MSADQHIVELSEGQEVLLPEIWESSKAIFLEKRATYWPTPKNLLLLMASDPELLVELTNVELEVEVAKEITRQEATDLLLRWRAVCHKAFIGVFKVVHKDEIAVPIFSESVGLEYTVKLKPGYVPKLGEVVFTPEELLCVMTANEGMAYWHAAKRLIGGGSLIQ